MPDASDSNAFLKAQAAMAGARRAKSPRSPRARSRSPAPMGARAPGSVVPWSAEPWPAPRPTVRAWELRAKHGSVLAVLAVWAGLLASRADRAVVAPAQLPFQARLLPFAKLMHWGLPANSTYKPQNTISRRCNVESEQYRSIMRGSN